MLHKFLSWVIPNVFYQADGSEGGGESTTTNKDEQQEEKIDLDATAKLHELELGVIDQLFDRDDIDYDKLLTWMKGRDETTTLNDVLMADDKSGTDDKDKAADDDKAAEEKAADADDKKADDKDDDEDKDAVAKEGDETKAGDKKADDKKVEDDAKGKTDDKSGTEDKTKVKTIKISDEYITKQVQNFRTQLKGEDPDAVEKRTAYFQDILNGIKGGEMDSRALKNYINAQMYIKTIKSPFDKDWKPDQQVVSDPKYIEEATKQKTKMITDRIIAKFPEFPEDALSDNDKLQDFEESLTRRQYDDYKALYSDAKTNIENEYDRYAHTINNWEKIAADTIKVDVKMFESLLSKHNLSLKDLGINSLNLDEKDLYNEYLWKNILFVDGDTGKPNTEIMSFLHDTIPVLKPGAVYTALINRNVDMMIAKKAHEGRAQGFNAGLNNSEHPSTSDMGGTEHREKIEIDEEEFDNDDLTPEQIQDKLDKVKSSIMLSSGATVKKKR